MNFEPTEEQRLLRESARSALVGLCTMPVLRKGFDDPAKLDAFAQALWASVAELGWTGLVVPEEHGGMGLGATEFAILHEELGRALFTGLYTVTAVLAAGLLQLAGCPASLRARLTDIASGAMRLALLEVQSGERESFFATCGHGGTVSLGTHRVPDAGVATHFLLLATEQVTSSHAGVGRLGMCLVDRSASGVTVESRESFDPTHTMGSVTLRDAPLDPGHFHVTELPAAQIARVLGDMRLARCSEMLGVADRALSETVAYVKERKQFGQPVGSFQAVKHKLADAYIALENSRTAARYAALARDAGAADALLALDVAEAMTSVMGIRVTGDCIQAHGGMGFTWESDMHLYFKRARWLASTGRGVGHARASIASAIVEGRVEF